MNHFALLLLALPTLDAAPRQDRYFKITIVDDQTSRGVPLVDLRTINQIRAVTDSNGIAAFHEPGLMGQTVFFHIKSHGYEYPKDGFGLRAKALLVKEGGSAVLKIKRINIAERLYRVTGAGIYADSLLVGERVPIKQPLLNAQVLGSDSVVNAVYRGKVHWFWGDTNRPGYPLGNFHVPGAISDLPGKGGLAPEVGVDLTYFIDEKGFAKKTAEMPGTGPTWITGLVVLRDRKKGERMVAAYMKVKPPLTVYERGLCEWDDRESAFKKVAAFPADAPLYPRGQPFQHRDGENYYVYFADPYPLIRVRADPAALADLSRYEAYTCLKEGTRVADGQVERYGWKKNTPPVGPKEQAELIRKGRLKESDALLHLRDIETGKPVQAHGGSVYWNDWRRRWVMIAVQSFGTSGLGEVWYAEADTPLGPWVYARKVATHERYSFYNPKQHPFFDQKGGQVIYFEGTYTTLFSGNADPTPRYDYNQVMYRLDLSDPRLALPVPVYYDKAGTYRTGRPELGKPAFFALDRAVPGSVPVPSVGSALFNGLPVNAEKAAPQTVPLKEYISLDGKRRIYSTGTIREDHNVRLSERPPCRVWAAP
jgi:hypothetical protein